MKSFDPITFSYEELRKEAEQLRTFLGARDTLRERDEVLPFFRDRKHLSAFMGTYNAHGRFDRVAHELDLFGDFACDLATGDWNARKFVLVEFEDAKSDSVFVKKKNKATLEWSPRFEHGFSQIIDWFYKLDTQRHTTDFEELFGGRMVEMVGLLVVGRKQDLGPRDRERLVWRQQHVQINGHKVYCMTFDDLCEDMLRRLATFPLAREALTATAHIYLGDVVMEASGVVTPLAPPPPPVPPPEAP